MLLISLIFTACFNGELAVTDSNLADYDLEKESIPADLEEIMIEFSQPLINVEAALQENGSLIDDFTIELDDNQVLIESLDLKPDQEYTLTIEVIDTEGQHFTDQIIFNTKK